MTSTMTALLLVNSSHQAGSQPGILIFTPATVIDDGDATPPSTPGAGVPSLPTRRRRVSDFDGARLTGMWGTGGVDSSVQPFDSRFGGIYTAVEYAYVTSIFTKYHELQSL